MAYTQEQVRRPVATIRRFALRLVTRYLPGEVHLDEVRARKLFLERAFRALAFNEIGGDYAEFGCWRAVTFRLAYQASRLQIAREHPRHLWGFDSFVGLPPQVDQRDSHPVWEPGAMAMSEEDFRRACASAGMKPDDYTAVPGFYDTTLRNERAPLPQRVALAYVDCDLYSSTTEVLAFLSTRLQHGMIIALDDYFCFGPGSASGERLAWAEFVARQPDWRFVPYIQFGWGGMSFMLERAGLVPS